jgi:magnesium transporter
MRITVWENGSSKETTLDTLSDSTKKESWIDVTDPAIGDLENLADLVGIPRSVLIGRLRSNYSHIDSYQDYFKFFSWHLSDNEQPGELSYRKDPVVVFTNKTSVITISSSKTGIRESVAQEFSDKSLAHISVPLRVTYLVMLNNIEQHEHLAEHVENIVEKFEETLPPWPREFYHKSFLVKKEIDHLLRLLRHFTKSVEFLMNDTNLTLTHEERNAFDTIYDRAVGAEEQTETSAEVFRDLISIHIDTVSHETNVAMKFMAAITCIIAVPSVIGTILGENLVDIPWPFQLWQVILVSLASASLLAVYFYRKGWFRDSIGNQTNT